MSMTHVVKRFKSLKKHNVCLPLSPDKKTPTLPPTNDIDNDHSSSQLSVDKGLTYPEGQGTLGLASLFGEVLASCRTR